MAEIRLIDGLPYVTVRIHAKEKTLTLSKVLVDTGSNGTLFKSVDLELLGVEAELSDLVQLMAGIGGVETVIEKRIDGIEVSELSLSPFKIQMGRLKYSIPVDGILGTDFLMQVNAVIDFQKLTLTRAP